MAILGVVDDPEADLWLDPTRARELAGIAHAHPHMLRHATGYYLTSKGTDTRAIQAYLGHKSIQHTVRYTELSQDRFKNFWRD